MQKNGHGRESGRCEEKVDFPKETIWRNYLGADVWRGDGAIVRFKVLLYDDLTRDKK